MSGRARIEPGDGDRRHGTLNGYANLKCRCGACREANRVDHLDYMNRRHPEQAAKHRQRERLRRALQRSRSRISELEAP